MDICYICYLIIVEYIVFLSIYGIFFMIDYVLGYKMSFSEWRRIEIKVEVFFSCIGIKLEIDSEGNVGNLKNM